MIPGFEAIVEEKIKKAQEQGVFDNLEGLSKPLNLEDQYIPEAWRLSIKILKNSGFLPPELELKKSIENTKKILNESTPGTELWEVNQKKLNYLLTKFDMIRQEKGCVSPLVNETYKQSLIKKLS